MPYVKIVANTPIGPQVQRDIKNALGKHIELIDKAEEWLMVEFCENASMYYKGNSAPTAIASVELFGKATPEAYLALTEALTKLLTEQLHIPGERLFIKYGEYEHWGWNGINF